MEDIRKYRKKVNLCVQCGSKMDRRGRYCIRCLEMNKVSKQNYINKLREENKCVNCAKPLDREGWFCIECTNNFKLQARERNLYRRENGLCVQCGRPTNLGSYCRRCLDMRMDRYRKKKGLL